MLRGMRVHGHGARALCGAHGHLWHGAPSRHMADHGRAADPEVATPETPGPSPCTRTSSPEVKDVRARPAAQLQPMGLNARETEMLSRFGQPRPRPSQAPPVPPPTLVPSPSTTTRTEGTRRWVSVGGSTLPPMQQQCFEYALRRKNRWFAADEATPSVSPSPGTIEKQGREEVRTGGDAAHFERLFNHFLNAHHLDGDALAGEEDGDGLSALHSVHSERNAPSRQSHHHAAPSLLHHNAFREYIVVNEKPTQRVPVPSSFMDLYSRLPSPADKQAFWLYYYKTYYLPRALAETRRHHHHYVAYLEREDGEGRTDPVAAAAKSSTAKGEGTRSAPSTDDQKQEVKDGRGGKKRKTKNPAKHKKKGDEEKGVVDASASSELIVPFLLTKEMVEACSTLSGYHRLESTPLTLRRRIEIVVKKEYLTASDLSLYEKGQLRPHPHPHQPSSHFPSLFYFTLTSKAKHYGPSTPDTPSAAAAEEGADAVTDERWKATAASCMKAFTTPSGHAAAAVPSPVKKKQKRGARTSLAAGAAEAAADGGSCLTPISYLYLSYYVIPSPLSMFTAADMDTPKSTRVVSTAPLADDALAVFTTPPLSLAASPCWVPLRLLQCLPFFPIPPPPVLGFPPPLQLTFSPQTTALASKESKASATPPADALVALQEEEHDIVQTYFQLVKEMLQRRRAARRERPHEQTASHHHAEHGNPAGHSGTSEAVFGQQEKLRALTRRILFHRMRERVVEFYDSAILLRTPKTSPTAPPESATSAMAHPLPYLSTLREQHNVNDYVFVNDSLTYLSSFWQRKKDITYHLPFLYFFPLNALLYIQAGMQRRAADMRVLRRQQIYQRARHKRYELACLQGQQRVAAPPAIVDATAPATPPLCPEDLEQEAASADIFYPLPESQLNRVAHVLQLRWDVQRIRFHAWEVEHAIKTRQDVLARGKEEVAGPRPSALAAAFNIYAEYHHLKQNRKYALQRLFRSLTHFHVLRSGRKNSPFASLWGGGSGDATAAAAGSGARSAWANKFRFSGAFVYENDDYHAYRHLLTSRNTVTLGHHCYVNLADTTLCSFFDSHFAADHCIPLTEDGEVFFGLMEAVRVRQMHPLVQQSSVATATTARPAPSAPSLQPNATPDSSHTAAGRPPSIFLHRIRELLTTTAAAGLNVPHHKGGPSASERVRAPVVQCQLDDAQLQFPHYGRFEKMHYARRQQQSIRYYFQSPYWIEVREDMEERWGVRPLPHVVRSTPLEAKDLAAGISPPPSTPISAYHINDPRSRPIRYKGRLYINAEQTTDASVFNAKTCTPQQVVHVVTEVGVFPVNSWRERRRLQEAVATALAERQRSKQQPCPGANSAVPSSSRGEGSDGVSCNYMVSRKVVEEAGLRLRPDAVWLQIEETHLWSWQYLESRSRLRRDQEVLDPHATDVEEGEDDEAYRQRLKTLQLKAKKDKAHATLDVVYAGDVLEQDRLRFLLTYEPRILFYRISDLGEPVTANLFARHMAALPDNTYVPLVKPGTSAFAPTLVREIRGVGAAERWDLEELTTARTLLAERQNKEKTGVPPAAVTRPQPAPSLFPSYPVPPGTTAPPEASSPPLTNAAMLSLFHYYNDTVAKLGPTSDADSAVPPATLATLAAHKHRIQQHNAAHVTEEYVHRVEQRALQRKRRRYNYFYHSRLSMSARMQMAVLALRMQYDASRPREASKDTVGEHACDGADGVPVTEDRGTLWVTTDFLLEQRAFLAPRKEETIALEVTLQVRMSDQEARAYMRAEAESGRSSSSSTQHPGGNGGGKQYKNAPRMWKNVTLTVVNTQELLWKGSPSAMTEESRLWVSKLY